MFNFIQKLKNVREGIVYGRSMYKNRDFTTKIGMEKLSHGNYSFYQRLKKNILPYNDLLIVDVGANDGWFAKIIYGLEPKANIISFEPLKSQQIYLQSLKNEYPGYQYIDKAVGEENGVLKINEFGTSGLSSLRSRSAGSYEEPQFDTKVINTYDVEVVTLDEVLNKENKKLLIKIDTQGYEMEVLRGSENLISSGKIACIIIELGILEKYKGQTLAPEIINFLTTRGFEIFDLNPFFYEPTTGQMTEFDAVFVNKNICNFKK